MFKERTRVYVAGPLSQGDQAMNVRNALITAGHLIDAGYATFVPHATWFTHLLYPRPYEFWMEHDRNWLLQCHAILRLPGASEGADRELIWAADAGIAIYHRLDDLVARLPRSGVVTDVRGEELKATQRQLAAAMIERDAAILGLSADEYRARLEQYQATLASN